MDKLNLAFSGACIYNRLKIIQIIMALPILLTLELIDQNSIP